VAAETIFSASLNAVLLSLVNWKAAPVKNLIRANVRLFGEAHRNTYEYLCKFVQLQLQLFSMVNWESDVRQDYLTKDAKKNKHIAQWLRAQHMEKRSSEPGSISDSS